MHIRIKQAGDTIVEVLIALAVISLTIAVSYATAQRALRTGQRAHEQTEALKIAESQIEALKTLPTITPINSTDAVRNVYHGNYGTTQSFCINTTNLTLSAQPNITADVTTAGLALSANATPSTGMYHNNCRVGTDGRYFISISRSDGPAGPTQTSTFTVTVRWYILGGNGGNGVTELRMYYKIHKSMFGA